jgi:NAD(P)-dependent dehydrogenase (short-subunit alcohol dehydrogenase family)
MIQNTTNSSVRDAFNLTDKVAVITGGAGLLGVQHAEAIAELGGTPCLIDIDLNRVQSAAALIREQFQCNAYGICCDITLPEEVSKLKNEIFSRFGRVDILINNAANNPKVEFKEGAPHWSRFENLPAEIWNQDIAVGLTGAFLCSQRFGAAMAESRSGVILNIASDLGLIAPDQRIYKKPGETAQTQSVKPVTYSVVKAGLIGLTRYLATYWPDCNVRANALAPGGVFAGQDDAFVQRLTSLIPMGRMATKSEYKAAVAFMVSDASSYMNGAIISIDGGRTVW